MMFGIKKKFLTQIFFFSTLPEKTQTHNNMIKLSKWISEKSICSRSQAQSFIKLGLIRIDGKQIKQNFLIPVDSNFKAFTPEGVKVEKPKTRLWMLNKPRGYICSHNDPQNRQTIYNILPPFLKNYGYIKSVGRLDYNSEGLLLLTNDTVLKNLLENPETKLPRFYRVKVHGKVTQEKIAKMTSPIIINKVEYGPLKVDIDRLLTTNSWLNVELMTGKNRQIRRIMQKCNLQVNKLIRQKYGPYKLNSLKHGELMEMPISEMLERKLILTKAKELNKETRCLVEIDIRKQAIEYVKRKEIENSGQKKIEK